MNFFLISATSKILALIYTMLFTILWLALGMIIPLGIGKLINTLLFKGKNFKYLSLVFGNIGGIGFFAMCLTCVGTVIIQLFSVSKSIWWYEHLEPFGAIGFMLGILCFLLFGIFWGEEK